MKTISCILLSLFLMSCADLNGNRAYTASDTLPEAVTVARDTGIDLDTLPSIRLDGKIFKYLIHEDKSKEPLTDDDLYDHEEGAEYYYVIYPECISFYDPESGEKVGKLEVPFEDYKASHTSIVDWNLASASHGSDEPITAHSRDLNIVQVRHYDPLGSPGSFCNYFLLKKQGTSFSIEPIIEKSPSMSLVFTNGTNDSFLYFEVDWDVENDGGRDAPHRYDVYNYSYVEEKGSFHRSFLGKTANKYEMYGKSQRLLFDLLKYEGFMKGFRVEDYLRLDD